MKNILITGGAGFIGTKLSQKLTEKGYKVVILDNLSPQIHGDNFEYKPFQDVSFIKGDVRNSKDWENALQGIEIIVHLAAETGTGQSMYEVHKYVDTNCGGTARMLDYLVNQSHRVQKVIVASSRAIYGEGKYFCDKHGVTYPGSRKNNHLSSGKFEPICELCNKNLHVLPTDENSKIHPSSIYGITKLNQEQLVLNVCNSLNIPALAFRYQNVYGPGQSLKNPYTGILSIFSTQIRNGKGLNIFEDGMETRDFVYIDDVVEATLLGIESDTREQIALNVGSGVATTVIKVAQKLIVLYKSDTPINISGSYRLGDIRHNFAAIENAEKLLGFKPKHSFDAGITEFTKWVLDQEVYSDRYDESISEMKSRGLFK